MPLVSVIVPCYNEEATIGLLLEALTAQNYAPDQLEIIIADGLSTDDTRAAIKAFQDQHPELRVKVVDNPRRTIPSGLNQAIEAAEGSYIIRLDAHSIPDPDYIQSCVSALEARKGENVGGVWEIRPSDPGWPGRSIAAAAAHPLGVGDASYRIGQSARYVDTVPFGAFRRSLIDQIGKFDETLFSNEDYEFNTRIRTSGGRVWLDPNIRSIYFARPTFRALAQQYWRYGYWKAQMLLRYPKTLRWRQLSALLVISLGGLALASPWWPLARGLLLLEGGLYLLALLAAGLHMAWVRRDAALVVGVPIAIAIMHLCWGAAFLYSLAQSVGLRGRASESAR